MRKELQQVTEQVLFLFSPLVLILVHDYYSVQLLWRMGFFLLHQEASQGDAQGKDREPNTSFSRAALMLSQVNRSLDMQLEHRLTE